MKAIQLDNLVQTPDELIVVTIPDLPPHPTRYRIRIRATAINFFDVLQIQGKHQDRPSLPFIAGNEFSGEIVDLPTSGKTTDGTAPEFKLGDRVFGAGLGSFATQILAEQSSLRPIPAGWSFADASALFYTAPTAYAALVLKANARQGDYVLVHGAGGGIGLSSVTIAKALGLIVIASADTEEKRKIAKTFGADYIIDSNGDWAQAAKDCTPDRRGVDIVLDPLGVIVQSLKCIRWAGRLIVIGFAAGEVERIATNLILLKNVSVSGIFWGRYATVEPQTTVKVWDALLELLSKGGIKSLRYTEQSFWGLESVPAALNLLKTGTAWGKIVVELNVTKNHRL